jgi:hypothetical protein
MELGCLGKSPDCIAERKVSHTFENPTCWLRFGQFLPKPLGIDPVKPQGAELCGDDPVSDRRQ